jgi:hypothetical protein
MKVVQIMWTVLIVLCLFAISDCFAGRTKRSGMRSHPTRSYVQRGKKRAALVRQGLQDAEEKRAGEMDAREDQEADKLAEQMDNMTFDSEDAYLKSLDPEIQEKFNCADRLFGIGRKAEAIKLFEELADRHQIPLAYDRLGDIYLDMADEDPYNVVIAQRYFDMALKKGWVASIGKLLKVGEILGKLAEESKSPPMSDAARMIYG